MSEYRNVQTRMWRSDDWFQELPTDARLFWIYLFTNPSARVAGIYRLPTKTMAFECGLPIERIEELKAEFSQAGKAYFERDIVWVVKMRELQTFGKINDRLKIGIDRDISEIPPCELKDRYLKRYGYPMDSLSIGYQTATDSLPIPSTTTQHNTDTPQNSSSGGVPTLEGYLSVSLMQFSNRVHLIGSKPQQQEIEDRLRELYGRGTCDWFEKAIKEAEDQNKRTWSYVRAILDRCLREGIAPDVKVPKPQPNGSGRSNNGYQQPSRPHNRTATPEDMAPRKRPGDTPT